MAEILPPQDYKIYDKFIEAQIHAATDPALRAVLIAIRGAMRAEQGAALIKLRQIGDPDSPVPRDRLDIRRATNGAMRDE